MAKHPKHSTYLPHLRQKPPVPVRTPILPEEPPAGQHEDPEAQELIARIRSKSQRALVPTRTPILAGGPQRSQEPFEGSAPNLGTLLASEGFQVTEETLSEAAYESSREDSPDEAWVGLTKQMIEASCAFFAQEILTGPPQPPYNGKFFISEHHEEWDELVRMYDRICVLAARDHSKTFFFNFAYPLWKASTMRWGKGFILSATAPQAERILEDIIAEVEGNEKLHWLIPKTSDARKWSSKYVRFSNGHRIYARGFGTKVRGFHPDYIVCDDVLNDETAYSELTRRKQIDYYYNAVSNMVVPGGQMICVGTPFHSQDLYHDLEDNEEYEFRKYPSTPESPLWPERYSKAALEKKKREIGSIRFTREFEVNPVSDDMSIFPTHLFRGDPTEQFTTKLGMPAEYWDKVGVTRFMGVDIAMSTNVSADYTVIFTMGLDKFGNRWVVDIQRAQGLGFQEQLSMINSAARKYDPALIFIEDNQMQRVFGDELIRTSDLPIKKFTTGVQKNSLEKGVPSLRVLLENHKFRIPRGDKHSIEATDIWIDEMRSFTWVDGKLQSVGGHDDTVMACWICDQAIKQGGFGFTFGEDEEYGDSFDDFMAELTGEVAEQKSIPESAKGRNESIPESAPKGEGDGRKKLAEMQGEELLRELMRRRKVNAYGDARRFRKKPAPSPESGNGGNGNGGKPGPVPGTHDLVDENQFW